MSIGVIEARQSADSTVWTPIIVGNSPRVNSIRYITNNASGHSPTVFKTLGFNKDGSVSGSEAFSKQLNYEQYSKVLHSHCDAVGASTVGSWRTTVNAKHLRLVTFDSVEKYNQYLALHNVKQTIKVPPTNPTQLVIPQQPMSVVELYQEIGKIVATNPDSAQLTALLVPPVSKAVDLSDAEIVLQQTLLTKSLIDNAANIITARLEAQANTEIQRMYKGLGIKNPPKVNLTAGITICPIKPKPAKSVKK